MDYSKSYFGKSLTTLTWADIENFFNVAQVETNNIEFKSFGDNLDKGYEKIYKSVCALLNSEGGIIVWGAPKGTPISGKREKEFVGKLCPTNEQMEKDRLIQKISSAISPMPQNISCNILNDKKGKSVVIIEVKKSINAHQYTGTYYIRMDSISVPAPHYIVEALIKQLRYPELKGYLKFYQTKIEVVGNASYLNVFFEILIFNFSSMQNETDIVTTLYCDYGQLFEPSGTKYGMELKMEVPALHYGVPYVSKKYLMKLSIPEFSNTQGKINFTLHFAGKSSPPKVSHYQIIVSAVDKSPIKTEKSNLNILLASTKLDMDELLKKYMGS